MTPSLGIVRPNLGRSVIKSFYTSCANDLAQSGFESSGNFLKNLPLKLTKYILLYLQDHSIRKPTFGLKLCVRQMNPVYYYTGGWTPSIDQTQLNLT
jgi:hypothetical protein